MTARFVETDSETGDGYYEDDGGEDYSNEGRNYATPSDEDYSNEGRNYATPSDEDYSNEGRNYATPTESEGGLGSSIGAFLKSIGVTDKNGGYDLSKILGLAGAGIGLVGAATAPTQTIKSLSELKGGMVPTNVPGGWTPEQTTAFTRPMQTGSALQRVYAADMQSPITPGKTSRQYADGGEIEMLGEFEEAAEPMGALSRAFAGGVTGVGGGQSDLIDIKVSAGEYVMDAETVSALGDGNTEAGIAKLDELRRNLREHKRSAEADDIPPPAQGPLSYIQGA